MDVLRQKWILTIILFLCFIAKRSIFTKWHEIWSFQYTLKNLNSTVALFSHGIKLWSKMRCLKHTKKNETFTLWSWSPKKGCQQHGAKLPKLCLWMSELILEEDKLWKITQKDVKTRAKADKCWNKQKNCSQPNFLVT